MSCHLRFFGAATFATLLMSSTAAIAAEPLCKLGDIRLVTSIREIAQPYHGLVHAGGKGLAAFAGISSDNYILQLNQGDSDKQVSLMRSLLATNPGCTVFNVEPDTDLVVQSMVDTANESGAWIVSHWGHGGTSHPFDAANNQWIAHVAVNSYDAGVMVSKELMGALGGKGGIVALQGKLDVDPAQKRFAGLKDVLKDYPDVQLLDDQTASWDRTKAFPIVQTWLAKHGDKIKGIWAANDDMALGALEALRAAGLAGKIPVVGVDGVEEVVAAVEKGEMVATVSSDGYYQGSIGLAMGVCVLTGQVPPPKEWKKEDREFYLKLVLINKSNASQFLSEPDPKAYAASDWQCDKIFARNTGPAF
ncbi:MAG: sugar ABC transporter substrate-binding protein [Aestuariivirga sp.]